MFIRILQNLRFLARQGLAQRGSHALQILRQVTKNISGSVCFTIIPDECSDVANKEQFTICIRWVDQDLQDHEDFIGLYEVENIRLISGDHLTQAIKDTLL